MEFVMKKKMKLGVLIYYFFSKRFLSSFLDFLLSLQTRY